MNGLSRISVFARLHQPGLGDLVQRNIFLALLRRAHPQAEAALVVGTGLLDRFADVLRQHSYATDVVACPDFGDEDRQRWRRFIAGLAHRRFELCVVDPGSRGLDAGHAFAAGIPERVGMPGRGDEQWLTRPLQLPPAVFGPADLFEYASALADALGGLGPLRPSEVLPPLPIRPIKLPDQGNTRPRIALHPGGEPHWNRRWPQDSFVQLGRRLVTELGASLFLLGDEREAPDLSVLRRQVLDHHPTASVQVETGHDLNYTANLLVGMDLLVGNDSGLAHVAAAVATPSVVVYGPTGTEFYWARIYPHHRGVSLRYPCQQLRHDTDALAGRRCAHLCRLGYVGRRGPYPKCLTDLPVDMVWSAVLAQLAVPASQGADHAN